LGEKEKRIMDVHLPEEKAGYVIVEKGREGGACVCGRGRKKEPVVMLL